MSEAVASQVRMRREIWTSLLSVLRAYGALARSNDGVEITIEPESSEFLLDTVLLKSRHAMICLSMNPASGNGIWTMTEVEGATPPGTLKRHGIERVGEYVMLEEGTLLLGDSSVELDMAAIDFVQKLVSFEGRMEGEKGK